MDRKNRIFLAGTELLRVLANAASSNTNNIKWRIPEGGVVNGPTGDPLLLTPAQAICIVRAGVYVGAANKTTKRVYYIMEQDPRPSSLWERNYMYWEGRAVLKYAPDQTSTPTRKKNKRLAELWDRMLKRNPKPKNWM
jgi:hypothetical protein